MAVGVTYPRGFRASGAIAGIKASGRPDVALIVADAPATVAGVFTRSLTFGPPVHLCRRHLADGGGSARAVLVSSGNANVATGAQGHRDAAEMASLVATAIACAPTDVLVCSTGVIGVPLPMDRVRAGVAGAIAGLDPEGGAAAAAAILTTDAGSKVAEREVIVNGVPVRIGGIAKGAGMIRPDLGTMIAVVTTDAVVGPTALSSALRAATAATFNRITVDGCQSTSDSVIALASGASGVALAEATLTDLLTEVCRDLALAIVRDGEGARRIGRYEVVGAGDDLDAERAARHVAEDQLVRCALHGADPNWGRIVAALGVCGAVVDPDRIAIDLGGIALVRNGVGVATVAGAAGAAALTDEVHVRIDLGVGAGTATIWGSDLSPEYVIENSEYTT